MARPDGDRLRRYLLIMVVAGLLVAGCNVRLSSLQGSLPREAAGQTFDRVHVIDESFLSGHPIDDAFAALGKSRSDATAVFLYPSEGNGEIGAVVVDGVPAATLLKTVAETWWAPATVARAQRMIGDRPVWEMLTRTGELTVVYQRTDVVYLVTASDRTLVDAITLEMP